MALSLISAVSAYPANSIASVVVTAGDLIVVGSSSATTPVGVVTCSDNAGGGSNNYNEANSLTGPGASSGHVFYAVAKASETLTVTVTNETDTGLSVHVVRGANQTLASVLDQTNKSNTAATSPITSAAITTTQADEYIFVLWFQETAPSALAESGTGFTEETEVTGHQHDTYDKIVSATGTYSDTVTSAASPAFGNIIASFKAAGATAAITAWITA